MVSSDIRAVAVSWIEELLDVALVTMTELTETIGVGDDGAVAFVE
jgi:hypothetical protein